MTANVNAKFEIAWYDENSQCSDADNTPALSQTKSVQPKAPKNACNIHYGRQIISSPYHSMVDDSGLLNRELSSSSKKNSEAMKLTIVVVACMAFMAIHLVSAEIEYEHLKLADKALMEKQLFISEIIYGMDKPLLMEHWIKMGGKLVTDKSKYMKYDKWMVKFYDFFKLGWLLPKGESFAVTQKFHIIQSLGLFHYFYYAKDWDTLLQNMVWARMNVNEGMFVHALTMTVIHREDMKGIILPQIYEIFPNMFLSSKYVWEIKKFNWDRWNQEIMLEKEMKMIYNQKVEPFFGDEFYVKEWKVWQWWKLMGLKDGWHLEEKSMLRENMDHLMKDPMWVSIWDKMKMVWLPVDYTRDIELFNEDSKISYFTEDVNLNAYWYYLNMDYSILLSSEEFKLAKDRRGEWWIYNVQQILARYYMERISHDLGDIEALSVSEIVKSGYNPQLMSLGGVGFSVRQNYWEIQSHQNHDILNKLLNAQIRIEDLIAEGKFKMEDGSVMDLSKPEAIEMIGNLIQGNADMLDHKMYGYLWLYSNMHLIDEVHSDYVVSPSVLMNLETMMRDPIFYKLCKKLLVPYYMFKDKLAPYTKKELIFPGVELFKVDVSKLVTYFDLRDLDVTMLLNDKMTFHDGKLVWDKVLLARQMRLNHKPFELKFELESDKSQKVVIRTFMAPMFDNFGERITLSGSREKYMELDEFVTDVVAGKNMIVRKSEDFEWTSGDPITYSEWYNYLQMSYEGKYQFMPNISEPHSLFPDHLILPRGWVKGMPMVFFFMVSPYSADFKQYESYDPAYLSGIGSGVRHIDNMPFGYPLDRKINNNKEFWVPNMAIEIFKIYHMDKIEKYYPMKWEKYGHFDYDF